MPNKDVFTVDGFHVPAIGVVLEENCGRLSGTAFKQYVVVNGAKTKEIFVAGVTVTVIVSAIPSQPFKTGVTVYTTVPDVDPVYCKVWFILVPESFENPVTSVEVAVQFNVAFESEATNVIAVDEPEHNVDEPE